MIANYVNLPNSIINVLIAQKSLKNLKILIVSITGAQNVFLINDAIIVCFH